MIICLFIGGSFLTTHLLWSIRQNNAGQTGSSYEGVFMEKTGGEKMTTWADWQTRIIYNVKGNLTNWIPNALFGLQSERNDRNDKDVKITYTQWMRGIFMFIIFVLGLFCLKRKSFWLIFTYLSISMVVLFLFPEQYQGPRYLIPLIPFFLFLFFNGISNLIGFACRFLLKNTNIFIPQMIVLVICAFLLYPSHIKAQQNLRATAKMKTWEAYKDTKMNNYLAACKVCKEILPDTSRMITRKPELYYMFSGYKKAASFPRYASPDTIISYLKKQRATHVILDDWYRHAYVTLYPAIQAHPEKFKVLKEIGKQDSTQNPTYVLEFNDEWGYHGNLINGKKTGEGYEVYQNGEKYVGHFANDVPSGFGIFYEKSGDVIAQGIWQGGNLIKGSGSLIFQSGNKYVGTFNNGKPEGQGILYDSSGKVISKGLWHNGVPVQTTYNNL
jgi:hypothetical protein